MSDILVKHVRHGPSDTPGIMIKTKSDMPIKVHQTRQVTNDTFKHGDQNKLHIPTAKLSLKMVKV